jgi:hypothetical protein
VRNDPQDCATSSPLKQFRHECRDVVQVFYDLHLRYPRWFLAAYIATAIFFLGICGLIYKHHHNPRLLAGYELVQANKTFDAIRTADVLAEDFNDGGDARDESKVKAEIALAGMQSQAHTDEGDRAAAVFTYYLAAVESLPGQDVKCAQAKLLSHITESHYLHGSVQQNDLLRAEVSYLECVSIRQRIQSTISVCHNEALSYLVPNSQPPVDACIYKSTEHVVVRK